MTIPKHNTKRRCHVVEFDSQETKRNSDLNLDSLLRTIIIHKKTNKTEAKANKEKLINKISVHHKKRKTNSKKQFQNQYQKPIQKSF
jgi:hypothetical protein